MAALRTRHEPLSRSGPPGRLRRGREARPTSPVTVASNTPRCSFDILEEFTPLPEPEFRHVLEYTERQRFKFKLSYWQARRPY